MRASSELILMLASVISNRPYYAPSGISMVTRQKAE
jgi:hypothetical protein